MAKVKEISLGIQGVIPVAAYENLRPNYNITIELDETDDMDAVIHKHRAYLKSLFELDANRAKADLIEKQYAVVKFYEKDGKKYPSVTSVLSWDRDWRITEDELRQYASRGTVIHKIIEIYLREKKWVDPEECPELAEEVSIVLGGSLGLSWKDCSYRAFFEKFADDIEVEKLEGEVINDELMYGGRYDILGKFKGKRSIMDWKTGTSSDFRQLAAYAACEKDIEQLVILPVGPTDNKQGYMNPKVCTTVHAEFKAFAKARAKFRLRFGI